MYTLTTYWKILLQTLCHFWSFLHSSLSIYIIFIKQFSSQWISMGKRNPLDFLFLKAFLIAIDARFNLFSFLYRWTIKHQFKLSEVYASFGRCHSYRWQINSPNGKATKKKTYQAISWFYKTIESFLTENHFIYGPLTFVCKSLTWHQCQFIAFNFFCIKFHIEQIFAHQRFVYYQKNIEIGVNSITV